LLATPNFNVRVKLHLYIINTGARGSVVVKALRYKPEGRGFETIILTAALGSAVYSTSNRNEYQKQKR
jgi:hypothetical protein